MEEITAAYVRRLLPRRDPMGHKGTFGKVLCVCGSVGFSGAAVFAGRAAVRTGSGLVYLGVPEPVWLHGRAGDLAARQVGLWGMTPSDLLDRIPAALREVTE